MKTYDAIIVLGGGIQDDWTLAPSIKARINLAKYYYDRQQSQRIIMSGKWSEYRKKHVPPVTEATLMSEYAQSLGLPPKAILKEEQSHNTKENIFYTKQTFLKPHKWRRLLIVTSDFHITRTKYYCQQILGDKYRLQFVSPSASSSTLYVITKWLQEKVALLKAWLAN